MEPEDSLPWSPEPATGPYESTRIQFTPSEFSCKWKRYFTMAFWSFSSQNNDSGENDFNWLLVN
jgi:hypothetical protein